MIIYDSVSSHSRSQNFPKDLPKSAAATHIGFFLAWAVLRGLTSAQHGAGLAGLEARAVNPAEYFRSLRRDKLTDEDFIFRGNRFAMAYYNREEWQVPHPGDVYYTDDYQRVFAEQGLGVYEVTDDWAHFDLIAQRMDEVYRNHLAGEPLDDLQRAVLRKAGDATARSVPAFASHDTPDHERGILRDLAGVGVDVDNLGQLLASAIPYPEAVPVFLDWAEHLEERVEPESQRDLLRSLGFLLQRPEEKRQTYPVLIRHVRDNKFDGFTLHNVAFTASLAVTDADFDDVARILENPDTATYMTGFLSPFIRDSGRPEAPQLLMDALTVRSNTSDAATALADLEITEAIPLIEDARLQWDPKNSKEVLRILAEALYRLRRTLYAREHAQAFGALTEQDLTSALRNPKHPDETGYAAHFLAELGATDALPALEELPKHPDTWVRKDINNSIKKLQRQRAKNERRT
ncbi:HEAT repeat domain-containing protein [Arthrobacter sp. B2a2-09]|uniref:HEAT repeat domain-containing protein n=1 Tax=Arthrobacter sp. B2a2-09 TaxID=2952822 RepID=UPI0022CD1FE9|nr:hypothetical protein [Arthrobacter sp. B2a2-09]MCZ9881856.1 hypothetical protein [Arthrobacter sp. B2a2-09]